MVRCPCADLESVVKVEDHAAFFIDLHPLDVGHWVRLMACGRCGQLWAVDEPDKYLLQLATKIPVAGRTIWQERHVASEKDFLCRSRGGLTSEPCAWARCGKPCVKGVAFCVDHLYESGARE